jgi:DNA topoisomerase-2
LDVERFDLGIDFETGVDSGEGKPTFHYLLEMKIYSLTKEKVDKLKREYEEKRVQYDELMARRVQDIWLDDLELFVELYEVWLKDMNSKMQEESVAVEGDKKKSKKSSKGGMDAFVGETAATTKKKVKVIGE